MGLTDGREAVGRDHSKSKDPGPMHSASPRSGQRRKPTDAAGADGAAEGRVMEPHGPRGSPRRADGEGPGGRLGRRRWRLGQEGPHGG